MRLYCVLTAFLLLLSCSDKKHFRQGNALLKQRDYAGAYEAFDKYVKANPFMPRSYIKRAYAAWLKGDHVQAYKDIEKVLQMDSLNFLALCNRGFMKQQAGRTAQAMQDYNKVLGIDKKNTDAYFGRAYLYLELNEKEKAAADIEKALKYGRFSAENFACAKGWHYYFRGVSRMKKQEYEGAIIYFSSAIRADSLNARAYYGRGLAFKATNDKKNACTDLFKARVLGVEVDDAMFPANCN